MQKKIEIKLAIFLALFMAWAPSLFGEEDSSPEVELQDMVVTATKTKTPAREIAYSVSIIDRDEIENSNLSYVSDVLQTVLGLDLWFSGPHSTSNTLSIRGMKGYHSKVLIDGIPLQDTSGPQTVPTLNTLTLDNVERIEVIRGASSTLYGANAVAGVVNIITRKGEEGVSGSISSEFGSHQFRKYSANVRGREDLIDYALSANHIQEKGISATTADSEADAFRNQNYSANVGYQPQEQLRLSVYGNFSDADQEYDGYNAGDWHIQRYAAGAELSAVDVFDFVDSSFSFSTMESRRGDRISGSFFKGDTYESSWRNTVRINDRNTTMLGYTYTAEESSVDAQYGNLEESYHENALYAQHQSEILNNLFLTGGMRYSDQSEFGGEDSYSSAASYLIKKTDTKLHASVSTGYRAPSLYELFDPSYGRSSLGPEKTVSRDLGFEQSILDRKIKFGASCFDAKVDDFIDWTPEGYRQLEGISSKGVEAFVSCRPFDNLSFRLTHTYMDTENLQDGKDLIRRPRNKSGVDISSTFFDKRGTANFQAQYVGSRDLLDYSASPASRVEDGGYVLANLALSYRISDKMELYGRIQNLFNEDYERAFGYNTYGRTYYSGLKLAF